MKEEVRHEGASGRSHTKGSSRIAAGVIWLFPLIAVALLFGPKTRATAPVHHGGGLDVTAANLSHPGFETVGPNRRNSRRLPLVFEANDGQADASVKFLTRTSGFTLFLTSSDAVVATSPDASANLKLRVVGGKRTPALEGMGEMPGRVNYLLGSDRSRWRRGIRAYAGVRYRDVYPGVDLVYRGHDRRVEFDFHVAPGADPSAIALAIDGAQRVSHDGADLVVRADSGELRLFRPRVYQQDAAGSPHEIPGRYAISGNTIRFRLGPYDATRPLVIDPLMDYATYAGGAGNEEARGVAVDAQGNAYLMGETDSTSFPPAAPKTVFGVNGGAGIETFVAKFDPTGILQFLTYVGGTGPDRGHAIAVDSAGRAYVAGETGSSDFPIVNAMQPDAQGNGDAFLFLLSAGGAVLDYSTYIAGAGDDRAYGVAVDASFHAFVAGSTSSTPGNLPNGFPVTPQAYQPTNKGNTDVFVIRIDTAQAGASSLWYSTFIGGSGNDAAEALAINGGNVFISGTTQSPGFPVLNEFQTVYGGGNRDAFVVKLDETLGALVYSSFIGGSNEENGTLGDGGIAVDGSGNAIVVGTTTSPGLATSGAYQEALAGVSGFGDAFVTKVGPLGDRVYTTYLGGAFADAGTAVATDALGSAYVTGYTLSSSFPVTTSCAAITPTNSYIDAFLARLDATGAALLYSTFLGGTGGEWGYAVAADANGTAFVAGTTGSINFPTTAGAFQESATGGFKEAFLAKIPTGLCLANLEVQKTATPDPISIGGLQTYTITVTNHGPAPATNVTLTDPILAGLQFVQVSPTPECGESGGVVTCLFATLAANASVQVTIEAQVTAPAPGPVTITNTATVSADEGDPDLGNNSATATTTASEGSADLTITQTDSPDPVLAGGQLAYTLTVTNGGPNTSYGVEVMDTLPPSVTFVSAPGCDPPIGQTIRCTWQSLLPGNDTRVITVTAPDLDGSITNHASVASLGTVDPEDSNNTASENTTVQPAADLSLMKTGPANAVYAGDDITYTLAVTNYGPSTSLDVKVTDTLPPNVQFSAPDWTPIGPGIIQYTLASVAAGPIPVVLPPITVTAPDHDGTITNHAAVVSLGTADPEDGNDTASVNTTVQPAADLSLTKVADLESVLAGGQLTYTLTVTNGGPSTAHDVKVKDFLPPNAQFNAPGWTLIAPDTIERTLGSVPAGSVVPLSITVRAPDLDGTMTNNASVTSPTDPNNSNNSAFVNTTVQPAADLSLTKVADLESVLAGGQLTYTLAVTNGGPSTSLDVKVTDTLPPNVQFSAPGWIPIGPGIIQYTLASVAPGPVPVVLPPITVTAPDLDGTMTNHAAVVSLGTADPEDGNDTASVNTTVQPAANLSLTKVADLESVLASGLLTYTLTVTNGGPSTAHDVKVTDTLPPNVPFSAPGWTSIGPNIIEYTLASISPDSVPVVLPPITVTAPDEGGNINNSAFVTSATSDPHSHNNTAFENTPVQPVADLSLTKSADLEPVLASGLLTYTLKVTNSGPSTSVDVKVTDYLPPNVSFSAPGWTSIGPGIIEYTLASVSPGSVALALPPITVTAPDAGGVLTNYASVTSATSDPDDTYDWAFVNTTVRPVADLEVTKTAPGAANPYDHIIYTVTFKNNGPSPATGVSLSDTLPAKLKFMSVQGQGCTPPAQNLPAPQTITWTGTLAKGDTRTCTIVVLICASTPGPGGDCPAALSVSNTANVAGNEVDPKPLNNSSTAKTNVTPADLKVEKTGPAVSFPFQTITYNLKVSNLGPAPANDVWLVDTLPANTTLHSVQQGCYAVSASVVVCPLQTIANGSNKTRWLKVTTGSPGVRTNTATVVLNEFDPNLADNTATAVTNVIWFFPQ